MSRFILYPKKITNFNSCRSNPSVSFGNYIIRLISGSLFSASEITLSIIYLKKYSTEDNNITTKNIHIIFAISLYLAVKWIQDYDLNINKIILLFGITKEELINLESEYLKKINWELYVSKDEFYYNVRRFDSIHQKLIDDNSIYKTKKDRYLFIIQSEMEKLISKNIFCCF